MSHDLSRVSIVIVPRERFSVAVRSLDAILAATPEYGEIIYVDGASPPHVKDQIAERARRHGFQVIRTESYLTGNQARNLGLANVERDYTVFMDNDTIPAPGWLDALVGCAEETGAAMVGPVYLYGAPELGKIHMAGGELKFGERDPATGLRPLISKRHLHQEMRLCDVEAELHRCRVDFVEYHCCLVRTEALRAVGGLDESMISNNEHVDLALELFDRGEDVYLEPAAKVGYLHSDPYELCDLPYRRLRWSEDWWQRSAEHFDRKWNLALSDQVISNRKRYFAYLKDQILLPEAPEGWSNAQPMNLNDIAQDALGFRAQLRRLSYDDDALEKVDRALELAEHLFGESWRDDRAFVSHLIATASILANYGAPVDLVNAGLLHAAYRLGHFPLLARSAKKRRALLIDAVGPRAEAIVARYTIHGDNLREAPAKLGDPVHLSLPDAGAVLVRIANEIDEDIHEPFHLTGKPRFWREKWRHLFTAVADTLDTPGMLATLAALEREQTRTAEDGKKTPAKPKPSYRKALFGFRVPLRKELRLADYDDRVESPH